LAHRKSQCGNTPASSTSGSTALGYIRQLYHIEQEISERSVEEKYRARQALSVPKLAEFKAWLTKNRSRVMKGVTDAQGDRLHAEPVGV
jgi:hypothetical protein